MANNIVTYFVDDNRKPKGIMSNIIYQLIIRGVIKETDHRPITQISDEKLVGAFISVKGPKWLVDFLSWATDNPFSNKNYDKQYIETDPSGNIVKNERLGA